MEMIYGNLREICRNSRDLELGVGFRSCITYKRQHNLGCIRTTPSKYSGFVIVQRNGFRRKKIVDVGVLRVLRLESNTFGGLYNHSYQDSYS